MKRILFMFLRCSFTLLWWQQPAETLTSFKVIQEVCDNVQISTVILRESFFLRSKVLTLRFRCIIYVANTDVIFIVQRMSVL